MRIHLSKNNEIPKRLLRALCALVMTSIVCRGAYAKGPYVYNNHGRRDPFVPLVGVAARATQSIADIMGIEDVRLQGVAADASGRMSVIINGEMIKEGETIGRLTIKEVSRNRVKLIIDENEHTLSIYKDER